MTGLYNLVAGLDGSELELDMRRFRIMQFRLR